MSRMLAIVIALGLRTALAQQAAVIPAQTPVEIELLDRLSSDTMKNGQAVAFKIVRPVVVDGATVMEAGTAVSGEVKAVKASGAWKKQGALDLILKPMRLSDGTMVQLDFARPKLLSTRGENALSTALAVPAALYYFPFLPVMAVVAAQHGKPYVIRAGERYLVYVISSAPGETSPVPRDAEQESTGPPSPASQEPNRSAASSRNGP